ncbi:cobalamin biosynthesis protein [Gordonia phage Kvothe]|uniref:CobT-like cobalamin biosynthesis protein n=1 Tax=Gordonia phage Kvothe TaxID=1838071 RepID=A0A166Y7G9_9CAUD|nr:cobalamin biosynthesis protein [Gordonia phage Kvothe]ANA86143.1 CobT-like cobalamin biosynthesis protein [Gordonia phage Kvothe]
MPRTSFVPAKYSRYDRAIGNLRSMLPQLQVYARDMTGNKKLKLAVGSQSQTDGDTIWLRPPMSLAYTKRHRPTLCRVYDALGTSLCPSCADRQFIMATLQHEIGHCMMGSFEKLENQRTANAVATMRNFLRWEFYVRLHEGLSEIGTYDTSLKFVSLARHPWLQAFTLMGEDIRCNKKMFDEFPEMEEEFRARGDRIINEGIEGNDGGLTLYSDLDKDKQISLIFLVKATGVEYEYHFDPEVVELVDSPKGEMILDKFLNARDVYDTMIGAAMALAFANENELCLFDADADDEELDELLKELMKFLAQFIGHGAGGANDTPQRQTGKAQAGGEDEGEAPAGGDDDDDDEEDEDAWGAGGNHHGKAAPADAKTEEELTKVIESLALLGSVPINVAQPLIIREGDSKDEMWTESGYYGSYVTNKQNFKVPESIVGASVNQARIAFGFNARVEKHRNQRSGRVHGKSLAKRVPFGDDRIFATKVRPDARSYHVVIGMDSSGSTAGRTYENIKMAVLGMADVCSRVNVSFEIWGHTTYDLDGDDYEYWSEARMGAAFYEIKAADEPWSTAQKDRLRRATAVSGNLDGHSLRFYRSRADKAKATEKIIMYYTDGAMPASNYNEELDILKDELELCKRQRYTVLGVGAGTDSPTKHGLETVRVDSSSDYRTVVEHLGKRLR